MPSTHLRFDTASRAARLATPPSSRRIDLDGLRGIAILGVFLHHIDPRLVRGGFVGVDVFFAISGYLITTVILRDVTERNFSFLHFYARRAKRLAPAAAVMIAGVFGLGIALFMPQELAELGSTGVAFAAMASNFLFWRRDNYFAAQDAPWPLLHTWSLSIEEQFYLVYPLCLSWLVKSRCKWLGPIVLAAAFSFAWSCFLTAFNPTAAYYSPFSRAWELLAGAAVAGLPPVHFSQRARTWAGFLCLTAILGPMAIYDDRTPFPGVAAALPVAGTVGFLWVAANGDFVWKRLVSHRALVWLGLISYSLYLWHWPLLVFARYPWSHAPATYPAWMPFAAAFMGLLIACISYRWIEMPWRASQMCDSSAVIGAGLCSAFVASLGMAAYASRGFPSRMPEVVQKLLAGERDVSERRDETIFARTREIDAGNLPPLGVRNPTATPSFALWGDSHADALVPVFDELAKRNGATGVALTRGATPPLATDGIEIVQRGPYPNDREFTRAAVRQIVRCRIPVVVLAARWSGYLSCDIRIAGKSIEGTREKCDAIASSVKETIGVLKANGTHTIWILREVPAQPFMVPRALGLHALRQLPLPRGTARADYEQYSGQLNELLATLSDDRVHVLDIASPILDNPDGLITADGKPLYVDMSHLSATGALWLADALEPVFTSITNLE